MVARQQPQAPSAARVHILAPERDAVLTGRSVPVVLEAEGIKIAPETSRLPGTAHHHLFLDADVTPIDSAIPWYRPGIVHLRLGQSWYTFEPVKPGPHRLIAVLAASDHVPLKPLVADTVRFTIKPRR